MSIIEMLLLAFGVSLDAFSVSISGALLSPARPWRNASLAALFFGTFQIAMPLAGGFIGLKFGPIIASFDHYLAFVLLAFVGGKMIYESFKPETPLCKDMNNCHIFNFKSLFVLGIATSIDAAAVGASITLSGNGFYSALVPASLLMGASTAIFSFSGVFIGRCCGKLFGNKSGIIGGVVLIAIGIKILAEHLAE